MHQALYRKYRPQSFDDVYGQKHITSILKQEAATDSVSHAYLFSGSRGTGKTTCAKILAKAVNCLNPKDGNPCNECENCRAIDSGNATDVIEMDAATNTGVDYIRDLRENVIYTPAMLKKRVYIIDEAHMLSDSAFNALLKTIEEPPKHVLYIFATTEPHKIPATIISRCQRFDFRRISVSDIVERLLFIAERENINLTKEGAILIARTAQGGMRDAISLTELCAGSGKEIDKSLVNEVLGTNSYEKICGVARNIASKNYAGLFETVNDIFVSSKDILVFFSDLTSLYRDMIVCKSSGSSKYFDLTEQEYKELEGVASLFDMGTLIYHSSLLDSAYNSMMRNPSAKRLTVEITLIKMCEPKLTATPEAVLARLCALEDRVTMLSKGIIPNEATPDKPASEVGEVKNTQNAPLKKSEAENTVLSRDKESGNDDYEHLDEWDEVICKAGEKDAAVESFLKNCDCVYSKSKDKYYIISSKKLMATMLGSDKNRKCIFDAMVCCDVNISSPSQIEIIFKPEETKKSDLDEF